MNVLRLGSLTAAWAACITLGACGGEDDGNESPRAGTGGAISSGGLTSGGTTSGGLTGGGVNNGGTGALAGRSSGTGGRTVTSAECVASHFSGPGITQACKQCMCDCDAATASICDENCWSLTRCVQRSCAANATDLMCITTNCLAFLSGATAAAPLTSCFAQCGPGACSSWFLGDGPGTEGGAGGAGGAGGIGGAGGASDQGGNSTSGAAGTPDAGAAGSAGQGGADSGSSHG
jgi:hypothetical protein